MRRHAICTAFNPQQTCYRNEAKEKKTRFAVFFFVVEFCGMKRSFEVKCCCWMMVLYVLRARYTKSISQAKCVCTIVSLCVFFVMLRVTKRLLDFHNIQNRIRSKLIWNTIFCSWLALTQIQRKPCAQHTYWRLWNAPNISYYSYSLTLSVSVSLSPFITSSRISRGPTSANTNGFNFTNNHFVKCEDNFENENIPVVY